MQSTSWTRMPRRVAWTAVALGATVVLTGCGKPSRDAYIARADAVCKKVNAQAAKLPLPPDQQSDLADGRYLQQTSGLLLGQLTQLRKLALPSGDADRLRDVYARERTALQAVRAAAVGLQHGDGAAARSSLSDAQSNLLDLRVDLREYGFRDCADST